MRDGGRMRGEVKSEGWGVENESEGCGSGE